MPDSGSFSNFQNDFGGAIPVYTTPNNPKGFQALAVPATTGGVALTVPTGAKMAVVSCETAGLRWRDDGTAPTSSVGMPVFAGQSVVFSGASMNAVLFIQTASGSALSISYYG